MEGNFTPEIGDEILYPGVQKIRKKIIAIWKNNHDVVYLGYEVKNNQYAQSLKKWSTDKGIVLYDRSISDSTLVEWTDASSIKIIKKKGIGMGKFIETAKKDLGKASIRVAGNQLNKLIVKVILQLLRNQGFTKRSEISTLEKFFSTPIGSAFVSLAGGQILTFAPYLKDQVKVQQLAEELRINGYATAGNELVEFVKENFLGDLLSVLKHLPAGEEVAKHRIATSHPLHEDEEEEDFVPAKARK